MSPTGRKPTLSAKQREDTEQHLPLGSHSDTDGCDPAGGERRRAMAPKRAIGSTPSRRFERFRDAYERTGNAYRAALWAGYSNRMAHSKSYLLAKRVRALTEHPRGPIEPND
jgi:hypothetical protein